MPDTLAAPSTAAPARTTATALLAVWALLQLPRLIAVPLMGDVLAGTEDEAWMFPAMLDVVVAATALPLAWAVLRRRGLAVWTGAVLFLVVSMIDHVDASTAGMLTPTPQIFGGPDGPASAAVVPLVQMAVDLAALAWVLSGRGRRTLLG